MNTTAELYCTYRQNVLGLRKVPTEISLVLCIMLVISVNVPLSLDKVYNNEHSDIGTGCWCIRKHCKGDGSMLLLVTGIASLLPTF